MSLWVYGALGLKGCGPGADVLLTMEFMTMQKISFYSQKGGVGKSTISFNVAAELGRIGKKVLIIDADPQANLSLITANMPALTLSNVLLKDGNALNMESVPAAAAVIATPFKNVSVLPANRTLAPAAALSHAGVAGALRFRQVLSGLHGFDFVLVDSAPTNSALTVSVLSYVDAVFVPLGPGCWDVAAIGKTAETVREVAESFESTVSVAGVVLNRWTKTKVAKEVAAEVELSYKGRILGVIQEGVKLGESIYQGRPVVDYAPDSPISDSIKSITRNLVQWSIKKAAA
jgi:chromosome partitioning protein